MMQPYPAYKNAGVPWLGDIPEHWEMDMLKTVLHVRNENNSPVKTKQILSLSIAHGVTLYSHEGRGGNKHKEDISAYKIAYAGDIILNSMNIFAGAVGLSKYTGAISPVYYALFPASDGVDGRYYEKLFKNIVFQKYLLIYGKGILIKQSGSGKLNTIRMKISANDLKGVLLPLPPFAEQKQIAAFLDWKSAQIQRLIDNKQQQMAMLKAYKQSMIHRAVTRGLNPAVKFKPSGVPWLGDIPEHWEVAPLKHLTFINSRVLSETTDQHYSFKYVDISSVGSGDLVANPETMQFHQAPSRARRILQQGDTIISTVRTYLKAVYYVADDVQDWVASTGFAVLTPKQEIFPPFLSLLVQGDQFINLVIRQSVGVAYPAISETKLGALYVAYPELDEQKQIVEYLEQRAATIDRAINRAAQEIQLLAEYRTRLIADVVTGKLDVRAVALPPNETAH